MRISTFLSRAWTTGPEYGGTGAGGEFLKFGYFGGRVLSEQSPLLFLVAPALHVHPATDVILRYLSPDIDWAVVGIDERWREGVRVVFRKRALREGKRDDEHSLRQTTRTP
jgi:hypothetical protein